MCYKCSVLNCFVGGKYELFEIDGGKSRIYLCPAHMASYMNGLIKASSLKVHKNSSVEKYICELCGAPAVKFTDIDDTMHLCETHLEDLLFDRMSYGNINWLYSLHPDVYIIKKRHQYYADVSV